MWSLAVLKTAIEDICPTPYSLVASTYAWNRKDFVDATIVHGAKIIKTNNVNKTHNIGSRRFEIFQDKRRLLGNDHMPFSQWCGNWPSCWFSKMDSVVLDRLPVKDWRLPVQKANVSANIGELEIPRFTWKDIIILHETVADVPHVLLTSEMSNLQDQFIRLGLKKITYLKCLWDKVSAETSPAQKLLQTSGTPLLLQHGSWFFPSTMQLSMSHVQLAQIMKSTIWTSWMARGSQNFSMQGSWMVVFLMFLQHCLKSGTLLEAGVVKLTSSMELSPLSLSFAFLSLTFLASSCDKVNTRR